MDLFRKRREPVTAFREKFVNALKKDAGSEEVVSMRAAMDEFHNNLTKAKPLPENITLMPPDDITNSQCSNISATVTNNLKVSQVTTRRSKLNDNN